MRGRERQAEKQDRERDRIEVYSRSETASTTEQTKRGERKRETRKSGRQRIEGCGEGQKGSRRQDEKTEI